MTHQAELSARIVRWNDGAQDALRGYNRVSPHDPDYNEGYNYIAKQAKVATNEASFVTRQLVCRQCGKAGLMFCNHVEAGEPE